METNNLEVKLKVTPDEASAKAAGKQAGKVISKEMSKTVATDAEREIVEATAQALKKGVKKGITKGLTKAERLTKKPTYTSNKYLGVMFEHALGVDNPFRATQEMVEKLFPPSTAKGRGGLGRDYVGNKPNYAKIVSEIVQRNSEIRTRIADRIEKQPMYESLWNDLDRGIANISSRNGKAYSASDAALYNAEIRKRVAEHTSKQSMYESLWESLDKGATVYNRKDVMNKDYFGMGMDSIVNGIKRLKDAKKLQPVFQNIAESFKRIQAFMGRVGRIAIYRAIRTVLKEISQALKEGVNNLYQWSKLQSSGFGNAFAKSMDKIATAMLTVKNSIATVVAPIITTLAPAVENLATAFQNLSENLAQFFATILNTGYYYKATKSNIAYAASVDAVKNSLMGFDELNVLNGSDTSDTITDYNNLFNTVTLTDELESQIATKMIDIGTKVGAAQLGLGAILALTGANIPLGIGLMATGALSIGKTISTNWDALTDEMKIALGIMETTMSVGSLGLGCILAFSGANIPLGIGLIAAGAVGLASTATIDWSSTSDEVKTQISKMTAVTSALLLGLGCVLAFSGANIPLGIGLIAAGAVGLATAATINWDTIKEHLETAWNGIKTWFNQDIAPKFTSEYWEAKGKTLVQGLIQGMVLGWNENNQSLGNGLLGQLFKGAIQLTSLITTGSTLPLLSTNKATSSTTSTVSTGHDVDWWMKYYGGNYATGGTPDTGSLFLAGEAGPELVTQIGGRSTVYNEEQLGSSMAYANEGVIAAINTLIGVVRSKNSNVTISASDIRKAVNNSSMRLGV